MKRIAATEERVMEKKAQKGLRLIDAIVDYIDKKINYELTCQEVGEDGYYSSHITERKMMEEALENIYSISGKKNNIQRLPESSGVDK